MNQDKEQRIAKIKMAIDSPTTPDYIKKNMREMIIKLEAPEPPPPQPQKINLKPKFKPKPNPKPKPKTFSCPPPCKLTDEQKDNIIYDFKKQRQREKKRALTTIGT